MNTPHHSQDELKQKVLEDKLKTHIQREFSLGEKVISLLKQKKELEKNLREQQHAQHKLEEELQTLGHSKQHFEQKYQESEKALQEKQNRLKTRSRIIIEDEEQSREGLEHLQHTIQRLQKQLKTVDAQKIEEKKLLVQKLRKLRQREKLQQQKLGKIVQQRDMIERRLRSVVKKYKHLSNAYHQEKKQHEVQMENVQKEQMGREARIELLRDEKQLNEESLLKEVESLKQSNAELEEKLSRIEQQHPAGTSWALDADLLQVIEKQNQYIQELKDKAHQRSTFLRGENDSLREEMEAMSDSQEKVKWENQMLESSLKDLQADLAEYIQLKHKFEEVQKEKEDFELLFQRRLRFFEDREAGDENNAATWEEMPVGEEAAPEETDLALDTSSKAALPFFKRVFPTKSRLIGWLNVSKPRLFLAVLVLIIVVLTVQVFRLIPWRYLRPVRFSETVEPVELPQTPELDALDLEGRRPQEPQSLKARHPAELSASAGRRRSGPVASAEAPVEKSSPQEQPAPASPATKKASRISSRKHRPKSPAPPVKARPTHILVQLTSLRASNALQQPQPPFPTIENNSILRRHHEKKRASSLR